MAGLGSWALPLTLAASAYASAAAVVGARRRRAGLVESARQGALVAAASATAASATLTYLLMSRDFRVQYVYAHVSSYLPTAYALSAFWAGQEGSLLLWLWLLTLLTAVTALWKRLWEEPCGPYVLSAMAFTQGFLALVAVALSNPFVTLPHAPPEGRGLNPLLQNVWMVVHPPVVFMGYAAYTVPFALAIGGLVTGRLGTAWLGMVRRWALLSWIFMGAGIWMGAWWAYLELGWGGYWGWDPVENSSLIPWLTGTALLHSLAMQRRRGAFKGWNLWLMASTFALCVFATFVTRSGIIQSVHAFGRSPMGACFVAFIALCLLAFAWLLSLRRRELGDPFEVQVLLSREASLLLTNLLLVGTALVVLLGTLFPALIELVQGRQAALDVSFYERTVGPLAQATILLIGVCPWLAWGGTSSARLRRKLLPLALVALATAVALLVLGVREGAALIAFAICAFVGLSLARSASALARALRGRLDGRRRRGEGSAQASPRSIIARRRRWGAHVAHLGMVLIAVGVTGSSVFQEQAQVALAPGESVDVQGYTLAYRDLVAEELPGRQRFTALVDVRRGDRQVDELRPEKAFYWNIEQWVTEVAIHSTLKEDLYLILAGFEENGTASFAVLVNPLVAWLWIGGGALLCGGAIAWWPPARGRDGG